MKELYLELQAKLEYMERYPNIHQTEILMIRSLLAIMEVLANKQGVKK